MHTDNGTIEQLDKLLYRPSAARATIRLHYQITDHAFISTRHPQLYALGTY